jgi:hypothetical protein
VNTPELTERWAEITGTPVKVVRARVRRLRLAGLLPDARKDRAPLTNEQIARHVIAELASDTHKDAPATVIKYWTLPQMMEPGHVPASMAGMNLGQSIAYLLRQSRTRGGIICSQIRISSTNPSAEVAVYAFDRGGDGRALNYGAHPLNEAGPPFPIQVDRTLDGRLLKLLS